MKLNFEKKIDLNYFHPFSSLPWILPEQFPEKNLPIYSFLSRFRLKAFIFTKKRTPFTFQIPEAASEGVL